MPPILLIGIGVGLVLFLMKPSSSGSGGAADECISRAADTVTSYVVQVAALTGAKSLTALDPSFADPAVEKCLQSNAPAGCRTEIKKVVAQRIAGAFAQKNAQLVAEVIGVCKAAGDQSSADCLTKKAHDSGLVLGTIPTPPAIPGAPGVTPGGGIPAGFPVPGAGGTGGVDPVSACLLQLAQATGQTTQTVSAMSPADLGALAQKLALSGQFAAATCAGIVAASKGGNMGPSQPSLPSI